MMETRYLVAYRDAYNGWWHENCGCDHLDILQELADSGARSNPGRQYAIFRNKSGWWMDLPQYVVGMIDRELYRHTFGCCPQENGLTRTH